MVLPYTGHCPIRRCMEHLIALRPLMVTADTHSFSNQSVPRERSADCDITRPDPPVAAGMMNEELQSGTSLPPGIAVSGGLDSDLTHRVHAERPHAYRTPFAWDGARILHARAFRRLAGKTQVFTRLPGDH